MGKQNTFPSEQIQANAICKTNQLSYAIPEVGGGGNKSPDTRLKSGNEIILQQDMYVMVESSVWHPAPLKKNIWIRTWL